MQCKLLKGRAQGSPSKCSLKKLSPAWACGTLHKTCFPRKGISSYKGMCSMCETLLVAIFTGTMGHSERRICQRLSFMAVWGESECIQRSETKRYVRQWASKFCVYHMDTTASEIFRLTLFGNRPCILLWNKRTITFWNLYPPTFPVSQM